MFGGVTPVLRVSDLARSRDYYLRVLGFKEDFGNAQFASVSRGRCNLFLSEGDQGHPGSWVWVGVEDIEALHTELEERGAAIRNPPTNYPWGSREMQVEDPDGNILRLGSDLKQGEPMGEWLDMYGHRWKPTSSGDWERA